MVKLEFIALADVSWQFSLLNQQIIDFIDQLLYMSE